MTGITPRARRLLPTAALAAAVGLAGTLAAVRLGWWPAAPAPVGAADARALLRAGWEAVDREDAGAARRAIRDLRTAGDAGAALVLQARLLVARGFGGAALEALSGLGGVDGDAELARRAALVRGEAAYRTGLYPAAERELARVVASDPDSVDAHRLLAAMYYDAGVIPVAIHHLEETARLAPADHRPSRLLGLIHNDFERYDEAVGHYQESLRRAPDQPDRDDVLAEQAACETRLRRHRDALATLDLLARPTPEADALRAECLLAVGDRDAARALTDRILAAAPDDLGGLVLAGTILLEDGDAAGAVEPLRRATRAHPRDYLARLRLAQALAGSGRDDEAAGERAEAERIRALRREFADLHQEAWNAPGDAAVRRRLAARAAELGRPDLERVWLDAAEAIESGRP